jgi:hypothetical protein
MKTVHRSEVEVHVPEGALALLSLTAATPVRVCAELPPVDLGKTVVPAWRATVGLSTSRASTSYQGEIDPFPASGSLLTFCSLLQFGENVRNYLLFVNVEKSPAPRTSRVEVYESARAKLKGTFEVRNNDVTLIPLDDLGLTASDLPLVICRDMAAIPLYLSKTADGAFLSLEHTHPPMSFVIEGRRWEAQKLLKQRWFGRVGAAP